MCKKVYEKLNETVCGKKKNVEILESLPGIG